MRKAFLPLLFCIVHGVLADEFVLNEYALHVDARDLALGGLICSFESLSRQTLECTYLMPYQLRELSIRKIVFQKRAFGLEGRFGWIQTGNMEWMENYLTLHMGKELSEQFHIGVEVALLLHENVEESSSGCFAEVDCNYMLSEKLGIGLNLLNPSGATLHLANRKIPLSSLACLGIQNVLAKKCLFFGEVNAWIKKPTMGRMGVEYEFSDAFILRLGLSSKPLMPSWGMGGSIQHFSYSWGGNLHPILGTSNGFTLKYTW